MSERYYVIFKQAFLNGVSVTMGDKKFVSSKDKFYKDLLVLTEVTINEGVALEDILEVLTLHGLNTYLRNPDNSFCCATDLMLNIFGQWYSHSHERSMATCEEDECLCDVAEEDEEKTNSTMH